MEPQDENVTPSVNSNIDDDKNSIKMNDDKVGGIVAVDEDSKRPAVPCDDEESSMPEEPMAKRPRSDENEEGEVLDLATTFGFKAGDRFEVLWEIHSNDEGATSDKKSRWWGATLKEHDGRTEDSVAVRVLDYDPYPEGGFPERSEEDVIFMGMDTLVNPETHDELTYRLEGGLLSLRHTKVEEVVNETLRNAMAKNAQAWRSISSAQQALIAEKVAEKKEKLLDLLLSHPKGVISSSDMKDILAKTMEDTST